MPEIHADLVTGREFANSVSANSEAAKTAVARALAR